MDLDRYIQEMKHGQSFGPLEKLTRSEAAARLAAQVDTAKLEQAARKGDMQALSAALRDLLATPEGRDFAAQVQKAVKNGGR